MWQNANCKDTFGFGLRNGGGDAMTLSDEKIIDLYWARNEDAIRETHMKYGALLYRIAKNILHDARDCEECRNDTYLRTWNAIPPARPAVLRLFLTRIQRNVAIDRYYMNTRKRNVPSEMTVSLEEWAELPAGKDPEDELQAEELGKIINSFLHELSEQDRYSFIARYYYAEPVRTIALKLRVSESSIYKSLEKMRKMLKARLDEEGIPL